MIYTIDTNQSGVSLFENDRTLSILQNVRMIVATRKGTVPMYREFGMSQEYIDKPGFIAETLLASELAEALEKFEPRATLVGVTIDVDISGSAIVRIEVKIEDE